MLPQDLLSDLSCTIKKDQFKGWDPFDGLNSRVFRQLPFKNNRILGLLWIQLFKRLPLNLRKHTSIEKGYNLKGLALLLSAHYLGSNSNFNKEHIDLIINLLLRNKSNDRINYCWGYNFPWQARAFSVKPWEPNIIVSSFVAQAFLDAYEKDRDEKFLMIAKSVGDFILNELLLYETSNEICFGYVPNSKARVHNANLMGGKLFAGLYSLTKNDNFKKIALKSAQYSINRQRQDGAWYYGELNHHRWVDNFHTGFNLVALKDIGNLTSELSFKDNIELGLKYHLDNHFEPDMTPKYYDNKRYPIDIHNFAQGLITFTVFKYKELADKLFNKAVELMWDCQNQYFYYQKTKWYTNKINYIRWSQAWMYYAISRYAK